MTVSNNTDGVTLSSYISTVFEEDNNLYLNLMENVWISEIDKYTANFI